VPDEVKKTVVVKNFLIILSNYSSQRVAVFP